MFEALALRAMVSFDRLDLARTLLASNGIQGRERQHSIGTRGGPSLFLFHPETFSVRAQLPSIKWFVSLRGASGEALNHGRKGGGNVGADAPRSEEAGAARRQAGEDDPYQVQGGAIGDVGQGGGGEGLPLHSAAVETRWRRREGAAGASNPAGGKAGGAAGRSPTDVATALALEKAREVLRNGGTKEEATAAAKEVARKILQKQQAQAA
ncbi:hypothetical protein THAOC_28662, partial [Thalassiosira oceanica]